MKKVFSTEKGEGMVTFPDKLSGQPVSQSGRDAFVAL
jgi:hypothetical protein